jgi:hypothetical protein
MRRVIIFRFLAGSGYLIMDSAKERPGGKPGGIFLYPVLKIKYGGIP